MDIAASDYCVSLVDLVEYQGRRCLQFDGTSISMTDRVLLIDAETGQRLTALPSELQVIRHIPERTPQAARASLN